MKNLFKICLMLTLLSGLASCESIENKSKEPFVIHVDSSVHNNPYHFIVDTKSVATINAMTKEVERVDSVQFGVCDTCTTGFRAAILENQLLAERLARESHTLREKIQKMNEANMLANQLIDQLDEQSRSLTKLTKRNAKVIDETELQLTELKKTALPQMFVKK